MNASGVTQSVHYQDTLFQIGEYEEELEHGDLTAFTKATQPTSIDHTKVKCVGSATCSKQKLIPKLYVEVLKEIAATQPGKKTAESSGDDTFTLQRRVNEATELMANNNTCDEFVKLMDYIKSNKKAKRRDLHISDNFVPLSGKQYKSSAFIDTKP